MTHEEYLTVTLLSPTPQEVEALHIFTGEWFLRQRHWTEICGTVIAAYVRDSSALEVFSTWDVAYRLIEMFLGMSEDGHRFRVRLRFSEVAYDEVELTGAELLEELPCLCDRIRAGEAVSWPRQEEVGLDTLPHVNALVSEANPEPWMAWLPKRCELRGQHNGVTWYGYSNCNYIVFQDRVIRNYGYHGRVTFNTLVCPRCAHRMLREWKHRRMVLDRILRRGDAVHVAVAS